MGKIRRWFSVTEVDKADADPDEAQDVTVEQMVLAVVKAYHEALDEYGLESGKPFTLNPIADMDGDADGEGQMLWCVWDCYADWYLLAKGSTAELIAWWSRMASAEYAADSLYCHEDIAETIAKNELATSTRDERNVALVSYLEQRAAVTKSVYRIVKEDGEQRYTLGVAYPADEVDSHGDFTSADELEKAAWTFMADVIAKGAPGAGTDHADGTDGAASVVESYIYRGPVWKTEDGAVIAKEGDWMVGAIWADEAWERVKKDELTGWSIQGLAYRNEGEAAPDGD